MLKLIRHKPKPTIKEAIQMIIRRQYEADVDDMIRELKSMMDQHEAQVRELA